MISVAAVYDRRLKFVHFAHAGGVRQEISRGVKRAAASATPGCLKPKTAAPSERVRGILDTPSVCGFLSCRRLPGVRKNRVPLANFRAPLRAVGAVIDRPYSARAISALTTSGEFAVSRLRATSM